MRRGAQEHKSYSKRDESDILEVRMNGTAGAVLKVLRCKLFIGGLNPIFMIQFPEFSSSSVLRLLGLTS